MQLKQLRPPSEKEKEAGDLKAGENKGKPEAEDGDDDEYKDEDMDAREPVNPQNLEVETQQPEEVNHE